MATLPPDDPDTGPRDTARRGPPLIAIGAAAALAGLGGGWLILNGGRPASDAPTAAPPASQGGLVIDATSSETPGMDRAKPLRCFVQGRFVGELTLADCAQRNGVATDALDVGIDQSGALAAAGQAGAVLTPLPPAEDAAPAETEADPGVEAAADACWSYGGGRWRRAAGDHDLDSCVQLLFAGRCEADGTVVYGRWGGQTLRMLARRLEISDDNRNFRPLAAQAPDCSLPPVG